MNTNNLANDEYEAGDGASGGGEACTTASTDASGQLVHPMQVFPFLSYFLLSLKFRKWNRFNIVNKQE